MRCYVYLAMSLQYLNIQEVSFNITYPPPTFYFLPGWMDNLKHSPDEKRAAPEVLASVQSSSLCVYKRNKSREAEHYSDSLWAPTCVGDLFWGKAEFTARVCFQIPNSARRQFNLFYMSGASKLLRVSK